MSTAAEAIVISHDPEVAESIRAARAGSTDALGALYARYADLVYTVAYRITGSSYDAEDVLQDVFVSLPRALRSYAEQGHFQAWLRRVAARTALMRVRAAARKREAVLGDEPLETAAVDAPHPIDPIELERLILGMPEGLRVVFVLREIEGYSHAEIASAVGITANNSAVRLNRAWLYLRNEARR